MPTPLPLSNIQQAISSSSVDANEGCRVRSDAEDGREDREGPHRRLCSQRRTREYRLNLMSRMRQDGYGSDFVNYSLIIQSLTHSNKIDSPITLKLYKETESESIEIDDQLFYRAVKMLEVTDVVSIAAALANASIVTWQAKQPLLNRAVKMFEVTDRHQVYPVSATLVQQVSRK
ncbi:hypothetical protein ACFX13_021596 [Malus domestica]